MRKSKKAIALLCALAMVITLFAIFPAVAGAATKNTVVGAVPNIANTGNYTLASLRINEDVVGNFAVGDVIVLTLPSGVEFNGLPTATVTGGSAPSTYTATPAAVTSRVVNVTIGGVADIAAASQITITMPVTVTSVGTGDINVNVAAPGTAIAEGDYTIGRFVTGSATASALTTPSRGGSAVYGTIRIVENSIGALAAGETIVMRLPTGYTWGNSVMTISNNANFGAGAGVAANLIAHGAGNATRTATFTVTAAGTTHPGIFDITTPIVVGSDAANGDITVSFSGTGDITGDLVIGKYVDFGVSVTAAAAKAVTASKDAQRIANVTVKEAIAGSLIPNRTVTFTLPSNTRFNAAPTVQLVTGNNIWATAVATLSDSDRKATITLTNTVSTTAAELRLNNADIDVAANVSGEINIVVGGTAGASGTVLVANASPIVTLSSDTKDIKVGIQAQAAGDLIITEGAKEAIAAGAGNPVWINAPAGVTFAAVPTVEVIEGNIAIDTVTRIAGNTVIQIVVDSQSTAASKIKVSNIKVTVDRTVPEGSVNVSISGAGVMQNAFAFTNVTNAGSVAIAKVITPAPGEVTSTAEFVIGGSTYVVDGVEKTMDVAPYIKDGRTFLPVRYVAAAIGVSESNILWDAGTRAVTVFKGDRIVQMTIGSKILVVNGMSITMDTAPEIKDGRTMLPIRWVAQALGITVDWDAETRTVTVTQ